MQFLDDIIGLIDSSIKEDAQPVITGGNIIKDGYNSKIDSDREIVSQAHEWVGGYQKELIEITGIQTLKIKFTNNSGYFIELPRSQSNKVPDNFHQKQTLTQSARYTTQELGDFEKKLSTAHEQLFQKEYDEFIKIRNIILGQFDNLYKLSRKTSYIDFYTNGANISLSRGYTTPEISSQYHIDIHAGKHPILDISEKDFISNDLSLSGKDYIQVITGPNMGGKSTFLRQNALLILIAHIGYDIPCKSARIGIVDKIFSRVGAGDNIYMGQSTFMVEMQEVSNILRNATKSSFIIIDEVGRGTSTYDGMSLAWSILKYVHNSIGSKMLFATHYHEIIDHAQQLNGVKNFSVAVGENNENIVFLRKIIPGGIKKSYGVEVAKLAGIPDEVLNEAQKMMKELQHSLTLQQFDFSLEGDGLPVKNSANTFDNVIKELGELNCDSISPLQSLQILSNLQRKVRKN